MVSLNSRMSNVSGMPRFLMIARLLHFFETSHQSFVVANDDPQGYMRDA